MSTIAVSGSIVLALTGLWHLAAAWHFIVHPARTIARVSKTRPVNVIATELFRFLGALNVAIVAIAAMSFFLPLTLRWVGFIPLAVANLSQLAVDIRVSRLGLAQGSFFAQIYVGDALFSVANAGLTAWTLLA